MTWNVQDLLEVGRNVSLDTAAKFDVSLASPTEGIDTAQPHAISLQEFDNQGRKEGLCSVR